jgi:protocatechuate 3,4-dioxygenase beta subunit
MKTAVVFLASAAGALLAQSGSVEGRVTNALTGEPVRKAQIMMRRAEARPEPPLVAATDAGGNYTIANVQPGRYHVAAERNGFARGNRAGMPSGSAITVMAGQATKGVDFKLTPHGVITGRVLDADGDPVANANVQSMRYQYVRGKRQLTPAGGVNTNDLGEYRLFGLAPGRYYVSARIWSMPQMMTGAAVGAGARRPAAPEESYVATYYPGTHDAAAATPVTLAPGDVARGIDIQLTRTRTVRVSGHIVNNTGVANRRVMVDLRPRDSAVSMQRNSSAARNNDGYFELRGVAPGSYVLTAALFYENTFYSARAPLDVGASNIEDVQLQLAPGAEIKGVLRVDGDAPLAYRGVRVLLTPRSEGVTFGGAPETIKEDGTFLLKNVAADEFTVNVIGLPDGFYVKQVRMGERDATYQPLDLTQGSGPLDVLVSPKAGQVGGSVMDSDGRPLADAQVVLVPEGDRRGSAQLYRSTTTDQSGVFQIRGVTPGEYRLFAWQQAEPGSWLDPEFLKPVESRGEKVAVAESGSESRQLRAIP